jgi:hypothetical protein
MQAEKFGTYFGLHHAPACGTVFQVDEGWISIYHDGDEGQDPHYVKGFIAADCKFVLLDKDGKGCYYVLTVDDNERGQLYGWMKAEDNREVKIKKIA